MRPPPIGLSLIEQAVTSIGTLAMSLSMVATVGAVAFGQFTFIFTLVLIAASVQYGLVGTPILVGIRALDQGQQREALAAVIAFDIHYRIVAAAAIAVATWFATHDAMSALASGPFAATYLWRETTRNALFVMGEPSRAVALGVFALVGLLALLAAFLTAYQPTPTAALIASTLATTLALVLFARSPGPWQRSPVIACRAYRMRFPHTHWSLAGSLANEAQTRAHVLAVQLFRGAGQLGVLEAARVLFAPLFLAASAWQRAAQPHLAALLAAGDVAGARRLTLAGVGAVAIVSAIYCAAVAFAFDAVSSRLFADRFGDVRAYAVGWAVFAVLVPINWTLIGFLNAAGDFRMAAIIQASAAAATLLLLVVVAFDVALIVVLVILNFVQIGACVVLFACLWLAPRRIVRN